MNEINKAISALEMLRELMLFDPTTGEDIQVESLSEDNRNLYEAASIALAALREKQERGGCNWCTAFNANRQHLFSAGNGMYDEATYAYCPMCGRRLEGKQG